jgi:hypothetical protein
MKAQTTDNADDLSLNLTDRALVQRQVTQEE